MRKVRLSDIAEKVGGVGTVTVHNAQARNKGVSESLRMQIVQVAGEMGYEPRRLLRGSGRKREGRGFTKSVC